MSKTKPIYDVEVVEDMHDYLKEWRPTYGMLFYFGVHTGFRISEFIDKRVRDAQEYLKHGIVSIYQEKNDKWRDVELSDDLRRELKEYIKGKKSWEYLFKSQKKKKDGGQRHICPEHVGRTLKKAAKKFSLKNINTHSMRKTFGLRVYEMSGKDIIVAMKALDHEDPRYTERYLGINMVKANTIISKMSYRKNR